MTPFASKLTEHYELIRGLRLKRRTWQQVADELENLGCITSASNVLRFYKRHRKRPFPIGCEPEQCGGHKDLKAIRERAAQSEKKEQSIEDKPKRPPFVVTEEMLNEITK